MVMLVSYVRVQFHRRFLPQAGAWHRIRIGPKHLNFANQTMPSRKPPVASTVKKRAMLWILEHILLSVRSRFLLMQYYMSGNIGCG
jgi:hypothetical protein